MTEKDRFAEYLRSIRGKRLTEPDSLDGRVDAAIHEAFERARESEENDILEGKSK